MLHVVLVCCLRHWIKLIQGFRSAVLKRHQYCVVLPFCPFHSALPHMLTLVRLYIFSLLLTIALNQLDTILRTPAHGCEAVYIAVLFVTQIRWFDKNFKLY